jgi:DNA-binding NtrC family response regulator
VRIDLPPLRERKQDILPLCRHFLDIYSKDQGKPSISLSVEAERMLLEHDYPGNIRELANILELAVILCPNTTIGVKDLRSQLHRPTPIAESGTCEDRTPVEMFSSWTLKEIEKKVIEARLCENHGHQKRTAEQLGISVKGLRNKILYYKIGKN